MYFQCDPNDKIENWSEDRIWSELQARVAGDDGFQLKEGKIFQKNSVPMRSYVREPMRYGRLHLAGNAAYVMPPTRAKDLNIAASDIWHLDRALGTFFRDGSKALFRRLTAPPHSVGSGKRSISPGGDVYAPQVSDFGEFDEPRRLAELEFVASSTLQERSLKRRRTLRIGPDEDGCVSCQEPDTLHHRRCDHRLSAAAKIVSGRWIPWPA